MTNKNNTIHIGDLIKKVLEDGGHTKVWFAEKLCYERANIHKILKKSSINTDLLLRISNILKHDFFSYYSDIYNDNDK